MQSAQAILRTVFGYEAFRGNQEAIITDVIAGKDALVLMPTGGGKSLCYQIPALVRSGVAIVVSPLIALMKDQVDALLVQGVKAAYLNSSLDHYEVQAIEQDLLRGDIDLLYVAPERLLMPSFLNLLSQLELSLFAIDEAHCVSQWGHDFRPEYIQLAILAERFPHVPRIALTATADSLTRGEIVEKLALENAKQFVSSFDRPNIYYTIVDKDNAKQQFLSFYESEHKGDTGIIYCLSRKSVDSTAEWLIKRGIKALPYHAGLNAKTRQNHQERFLKEDGIVMVATIAFGMGIDKPDVRFVAHLDLPKSLEGYYQETGRAGRDGQAANAFMTYGLADVVSMRRMLERSNAPEQIKRIEQQKLEKLLGFCESPRCRRQLLLAYFDETLDEPCQNCDTCLSPVDTWDGTIQAQKVLSTIYRTEQRFGAGHIIDILLGKETPRMLSLNHTSLSTFGIGEELNEKQWRSVIRQLVAAAYLSTDGNYGSLVLTNKSVALLKGKENIAFRRDPIKTKPSTTKRKAAVLSPENTELFESLRAVRADFAKEQNVPAYVIFHDSTLRAMCEQKPKNLNALGQLSGVGKTKLERYGQAFLDAILEYDTNSSDLEQPLSFSFNSSGDTFEQTLELILEGYEPQAIASMRKLKLNTVEQHYAELVKRGLLTIEEATGLNQDDLEIIQTAYEELSDEEKPYLKPLYEKLEEAYSYPILKCVRLGF